MVNVPLPCLISISICCQLLWVLGDSRSEDRSNEIQYHEYWGTYTNGYLWTFEQTCTEMAKPLGNFSIGAFGYSSSELDAFSPWLPADWAIAMSSTLENCSRAMHRPRHDTHGNFWILKSRYCTIQGHILVGMSPYIGLTCGHWWHACSGFTCEWDLNNWTRRKKAPKDPGGWCFFTVNAVQPVEWSWYYVLYIMFSCGTNDTCVCVCVCV